MSNVIDDSGRNPPKGDKSKLEAELVEVKDAMIFQLSREHRQKLFGLMIQRNHMVFTDTLCDLIDKEHLAVFGSRS